MSKTNRILLCAIIALFLILRLFSSHEEYLIKTTDSARYLSLAQSFPDHTLDNNEFYLLHPPLFPYALWLFSLPLPDYLGGIALSLLSSLISLFLIYRLSLYLTKSEDVALLSILLFSLSTLSISLAQVVLKESFALMLILGAIYHLLLLFDDAHKHNSVKNAVISSLCAIGLSFTTDHALLLILCFSLIYVVFFIPSLPKLPSIIKLLPIILLIASFGAWMTIKLIVYETHEYYPAGLDGSLVRVSEWQPNQLLNGVYFDTQGKFIAFGVNTDPMHYVQEFLYLLDNALLPLPSQSSISLSPKFILLHIPHAAFYGALLLGLITSFALLLSSLGRFSLPRELFILFSCAAIFLIPIHMKFYLPRYTYAASAFLFILISMGVVHLLQALAKHAPTQRIRALAAPIPLLIALTALFIIALPLHLLTHPHFVFFQPLVVEGQNTANFLATLPHEGIMASIGYTQELNYLLDKRILALPQSPSDDFLLDQYQISYIVYGHLSQPYFLSHPKEIANEAFVNYMKSNPKRFKEIAAIDEYYAQTNQHDTLHVIEVLR